MPPAILKGWLDRVLRQGVAYQFGPGGVEPLLAGRRAVVLTTSNTPRDDELRLFGDPLENLWKACVFHFCGVEDFFRRNFESIILSTPEQRRHGSTRFAPSSAAGSRPDAAMGGFDFPVEIWHNGGQSSAVNRFQPIQRVGEYSEFP